MSKNDFAKGWGIGLLSAIPIGVIILFASIFSNAISPQKMQERSIENNISTECKNYLLEALVKNEIADNYLESTIILTEDLRGSDYPPMRTTWPASKTIKFSLEKANLGVSEDYFAICSYLRNNSEISGEINLKIFNEMEFITSSKD